jgi:hypothetical protein
MTAFTVRRNRVSRSTPLQGPATAVVLPFTSTHTVQATPLDGLLNVVLSFLAENLFVYEPLAERPGALTT